MGGQVQGRRGVSATRLLLACAVAVGAGLAQDVGSVSADTSIVVDYQMNEGPGATVMHDSGPNGLDGVIGSAVATGAQHAGATGYFWSHTQPNQPPAKPERIVNVDSNPALNPDDQEYAIEFRYRTTQSFGNIVQKGQNATWGGYFKFEQPKGFMTCLFKDANGGRKAVKSPIATNDGDWHVIRCELSSWGVRLYVDGVRVRQAPANLASISNSKPLSIGGKSYCDQIEITCDYFAGEIDYLRIEKSGSNPPPPPNGVDCTVSWSGSTATLNWNPSGGRDVIRRNGSWLATTSNGTSSYVDENAPDDASYLIRVNPGKVDHPCSETGPPPPEPPPPEPPPVPGCLLVVDGSSATLTWTPLGGTDVVRRDGRWLATPGADVGIYVDDNPPADADYLIRQWVPGGGRIDIGCEAPAA